MGFLDFITNMRDCSSFCSNAQRQKLMSKNLKRAVPKALTYNAFSYLFSVKQISQFCFEFFISTWHIPERTYDLTQQSPPMSTNLISSWVNAWFRDRQRSLERPLNAPFFNCFFSVWKSSEIFCLRLLAFKSFRWLDMPREKIKEKERRSSVGFGEINAQ